MNANILVIVNDLWSLAGWTMVHFLWLGAIVAAIAFAGRSVLRNAAPNVRYSFSLMCLALITAMPLVATRFSRDSFLAPVLASAARPNLPPSTTATANSPPLKGGAGGGIPSDANAPTTAASPTSPIIELHTSLSPAPPPPPPPPPPPSPAAPDANPSPLPTPPSTRSSTAPQSSLLTTLILYLPWLWLIGTPLTFALLFTGLIGTRRLSRASTPINDGPIADALGRLTTSLRITRRVTVAVCERVAAPVLIGILRPMILLPPAALTGWSPDEIEMVLLHELAHIRRYDNVVNLAQRIIESLLFFHPAVWLISTWVRREREACCDAAVVARTQQPHAYATLLVNLAAQVLPSPTRRRPHIEPSPSGRGQGEGAPAITSPILSPASAMAAGPLRIRIRHILQLEDDSMLVTPKSLAITLTTLLAAATLAFVYLPKSGQAEPAPTKDATNTANDQKVLSIPDALNEFREALVTYDLDFDSVFPQRDITPGDRSRLERYSTREAWPEVLGHIDSDATKFRTAREAPKTSFESATGPNAYLVPLTWNIGTKDYATLLFLNGIQNQAHVVAPSYTSLACFGPMAGDLLFKSYASAFIKGELTGHITATSYYTLVVTGKCSGKIFTESYAMIYLMGGFTGSLDIQHSKVYIAGRTTKADLARIKGSGTVVLEESDLPRGEQTIDGLKLVVRKSTTPKDVAAIGEVEQPTKSSSDSSDIERFRRIEKEIKTIDVVVVLFNNHDASFSSGLQKAYEGLTKPNRFLYIEGATLNPSSPEAKRYGLKDSPTCIVFIHGKEAGRLDTIRSGDQLQEFVSTTLNQAELPFKVGTEKKESAGTASTTAKTNSSPTFLTADRLELEAPEGSVVIGSGDWPRGFAFPSPKEGEISKRAWQLFHVKIVPASDEELKQVLRRGKRGGLKLVDFDEFPHFEEPFILTDIGSKPISRGIVTFDDLATVLDTLESQPAGSDDIIGLNGEAKNGHFQYNLRLPSSSNVRTSTKFPSLEDQKLADLAWKRLGLELEPIAGDDLQRVKALGYDGGVKVVVGQPEGGGFGGGTGGSHGRIQADDILVGLHVWPTTNLKDIATILNRDDLAEFDPLKFYVIRKLTEQSSTSPPQTRDTVVTGRINVQLAPTVDRSNSRSNPYGPTQ